MKKVLIGIILLLVIFAVYIKYAVSKFEYDFSLKSIIPKKLDLKTQSVITVILDISIKSAFFFSVPVSSLYYEVYYKGNLLGKSAAITSFTLIPDQFVHVTQSVDLFVDAKNIEVVSNYLAKIPTDFTAKVKVNVFGIGIKLTELKFTY